MSTKKERKHRKKTIEDDNNSVLVEHKVSSKKSLLTLDEKMTSPLVIPMGLPPDIDLTADSPPILEKGALNVQGSQNSGDSQTAPEVSNGSNGNGYPHVSEQGDVEVVDHEDIELELQFDESSDVDSRKGSPRTMSPRCATRRSQTRNIPTPKTPRPFSDQLLEEKDTVEHAYASGTGSTLVAEAESKENQSQNVVIIDGSSCENSQQDSQSQSEQKLSQLDFITSEVDAIEDQQRPNLNISIESTESTVSTKVNVGGDVTRDADLTIPDEKDSFLNAAKDLSVVESLRRISSRRGIRGGVTDYRKTLLKSQTESFAQRAERYSTVAMKRKTRSQTPENNKRPKYEAASSILSYITSPVNKIKGLFATTPTIDGASEAVSASTPKLTSYKQQQQELVEDPELSKIAESSNINAAVHPKKTCLIM